MDCSLPGSSIHGSFQARVLEWGAIAFSVRSWYFCIKNFKDLLSHLEWNFIIGPPIPSLISSSAVVSSPTGLHLDSVHTKNTPTPGPLCCFLCLEQVSPRELHALFLYFPYIYIWDISTLEWVAYPFSRGSSNPGIKLGSPALQTDSLPAELPGDLPDPRIKPGCPALQADALPSEPPGKSCFCSLISNHIRPANNSFPINIP